MYVVSRVRLGLYVKTGPSSCVSIRVFIKDINKLRLSRFYLYNLQTANRLQQAPINKRDNALSKLQSFSLYHPLSRLLFAYCTIISTLDCEKGLHTTLNCKHPNSLHCVSGATASNKHRPCPFVNIKT